MAKSIKTKNMPLLPVITFATETNTHKKNFGKVSKSIILMIEGGKGMTNFLIIKPTHTYITLHTMYYVLFLYQVFTLGYIYLSINQICTTEMMMPCVGFFGKDTLVDII